MADLLSGFPPSSVGRQAFDQMPDPTEERWRQQQGYNQFLAGQWPSNTDSSAHTTQGVGARMPQQSGTSYMQPYSWDQDHMLSATNVGFDQSHWVTDMSMETASPTRFHSDLGDPFSHPQHQRQQTPVGPVRVPGAGSHRASSSIHSTQTSHSGLSPISAPSNLARATAAANTQGRPVINRSITAPVRPAQNPKPSVSTGALKGENASDDEDEFLPGTDASGKARGRKRQRIPHTAVERRYRENLNAHLDKLRQTVPALVSRHPPGGADKGGGGRGVIAVEGAKPSKCEILNGAIEHIGEQARKIATLENENQALRARLAEFEGGWYNSGRR